MGIEWPMFGKYAIRSLLSLEELLELRATPSTDKRTIPAIPAARINRVFIKQRYIWRLNNHRILAQASQKFFEKILSPSQLLELHDRYLESMQCGFYFHQRNH